MIQAFLAEFPRARIPVGPGDDCAVLAPSRAPLCVTTDAVVEGVHFTRPPASLADVGHKALAVNLSDLAAMGARPTWFLVALGAPTLALGEVRALGRGMALLARRHRLALAGGNLTSSPVLSVTITAAGAAPRWGPMRRGGAHPGDLVYVTGTLGGARAGLLDGRRSSPGGRRQLRPEPRVRLGLRAARYASAAIDVSDGLLQDAGHLARASHAAVVLEAERIPIDASARALGAAPALTCALTGGEDYELLLAVPPSRASAFERAMAGQVTRIGRVERGAGVEVRDAAGRPRRAAPTGYDHFAAPP